MSWIAAMFLRFVVSAMDEDSQRSLGVFQAVYRLRDDGALHPHEELHLESVQQWFNAHLDSPSRFTAAKPPHYRKRSTAISWLKDTAHEHIGRVRELVAILESHGVHVRMLKAERVGYVVYEDDFQVVAEPFGNVKC